MNDSITIGKITLKYSTIFFFLFLLISFLYGYNHILFKRPVGVHQWRNAFSAAYAMKYYQGAKFLEPQTYNFIADGFTSDVAVAEFPIFYYIVGLLYKIFGPYEFIYKLVNIVIGYFGLLSLYKLSREFIKDEIISFFIPIIIFTSVIFVFYLNNFIIDPDSLALVFIGLYQFYLYYTRQKFKYLCFSMIMFTLSGLMKPPSLMIYFGILFLFGLQVVFRYKLRDGEKLFKHPVRDISVILSVILFVIAWYQYKIHYTNVHGYEVSPADIRAIWIVDPERRKAIWHEIYLMFKRGYFHSPLFLYFSAILFIFNLLFIKKFNRLFNILTIITFIQGVIFIILFFFSLGRCDYYQINNLMFIVLLYLNFFHFIKNRYPKIFNTPYFKGAVVLLAILLINDCRVAMQKKYSTDYFYRDIKMKTSKYFNIEPYLRNLGIQRNDRVLVPTDGSMNITLYLMNQDGNTDFGLGGKTTKEKIEFLKPKGLKYLIVGDTSVYNERDIEPYLKNKIGEFEGIDIYKID